LTVSKTLLSNGSATLEDLYKKDPKIKTLLNDKNSKKMKKGRKGFDWRLNIDTFRIQRVNAFDVFLTSNF